MAKFRLESKKIARLIFIQIEIDQTLLFFWVLTVASLSLSSVEH